MHVQISGTFLVWKYVSEQEQLLFENICLTNSEKYAIKISLLSLWTFIFIYTFMGGWWRWALVSLEEVLFWHWLTPGGHGKRAIKRLWHYGHL